MTRSFGSAALASLGITLLVSACGGGGSSRSSPPVVSPPPAGSLQFAAGTLAVDENAGTATFTITRAGGDGGAVSVAVSSSDGSATAAQDYTSVSTTVSFAAGDATAKIVTITIADDAVGEADETLTLTLSAPGGGASVGATSAATLTIRDNDPPAAPALTVASAIKQLTFNWASVATATSYRLLQDPDGVSGFTQVGPNHAANVTSASLDIAVHRHNWAKALYRLEACNAHGCVASAAKSTVDAMLGSIGYFKASNAQAGDLFATALVLSADGSTLAVSATEDSNATGVDGDQADNSAQNAGAVYVFTRNGTQWLQQAYLKASNTEVNDFFGASLALSADGNTLAVGANLEDSNATGVGGNGNDNSANSAGAVYVFTRAGAQWSQQAYVKASNTGVLDGFGFAVALSADGDTLAVGAPAEDGDELNNPLHDSGAVYVFTRGTQWTQQAYLKASNADPADMLGVAVALSGDGNTLAVGASGESSGATGNGNDNSAIAAGAVYVFRRAGVQWSQQAYVKASNTGESDRFGLALALSADGNTLAVGAPGEDGDELNNPLVDSGAVYVFTRGTQWTQQAHLKASNADPADLLGFAVALSADGSTLAVGAPSEDSDATGVGGDESDNSTNSAGAVYLFAPAGTTWSQQAYVKASNTDGGDQFYRGLALSADGSTLAVGAAFEDSGAKGVGGDQTNDNASLSGAGYIF